jgi:hypothetical protein
MSINTSRVGTPVAIVKNNKKYAKTLFSVSKDEEINGFNQFELEEGQFQIIPDFSKERSTVFVAGTAGSGKSYWCAEYLREYAKLYPDNPIYLITEAIDADPAFKGIKLKKVNLDGILEDPIHYNEFDNCCVVFDDTDALTGKLFKYVYEMRNKLLKNSRKKNVTVITTSHSFTGRDLQPVLNESMCVVFFPSNYNRSLKYLLENYIGLTKVGISMVRKSKSRHIAYIKTFPNVLVEEKKILTLTSLQES